MPGTLRMGGGVKEGGGERERERVREQAGGRVEGTRGGGGEVWQAAARKRARGE